MQLIKTKSLSGPNVWGLCPVMEATIELGGSDDSLPTASASLRQQIGSWIPALKPHPNGVSGAQSRNGLDLVHNLALVTLELQRLAGAPASFSKVVESRHPSVYLAAFEYVEEQLARECLEVACEMVQAIAAGRTIDSAGTLERLRATAGREMLGPSTNSIVQAARARNIPAIRLDECSLVQLGHGRAQHRIRAAETDRTLATAEGIAQDKEVTRTLLQAVGVPVPRGFTVTDAEEAWYTAVEYVGLPVVVKPRYGNQGRGVAADLSTSEQVKAAFEAARKEDADVIVEKFAPGQDYRLLVVNGKVVAASRREPAHVIGDGRSSVQQLVDEKNRDPRRGDDHATALSKLVLDEIALQVLGEQGCTPGSVPASGERVLIRRNANLSTGGTATDVTESVCPEIAEHAVAAASAVGLDVAGIDVIAGDISLPLEQQNGVIVEVNAAPGLRMHLSPSEGTPRDVGGAIVEMLFPDGGNGRIPIAAVTGTNGKTTVTRFLAHLAKGKDHFVGMTCTDGIFLNGRRISSDDCSGPISAGLVLMNPKVDVAVFETARGGILRAGLGFDRCQVAVVTNIADGDHLGQNGVETAEELAHVKATIVRAVAPEGAAVLNAADPLVAAMAAGCPGRIVYFALDGNDPVILRHRASGGAAVFVRDRAIVMAEGASEEVLLGLEQVPITFQGRVGFEAENTLAALAGAWALGIPKPVLAERAMSFTTGIDEVPGRMNVFTLRGGTVILDYGHNAAALRAMTAALEAFPHRRRSAVYSMAGDRRDSDLIHVGELLGDAFDIVFIYDPYTIRDRAPGEIPALIRQGVERGARTREIIDVPNPAQALRAALDRVEDGDLLVMQPDDIDEATALVRTYLGQLTELVGERKAT
ncbi:cyanophycin synthetase [Paludibaculum fermentans]|uniref:cyanophycin synthetase n=1 Tax=Paludibaculum fermentans TaxID=1473598 RepID=UPI003EBAB3A9